MILYVIVNLYKTGSATQSGENIVKCFNVFCGSGAALSSLNITQIASPKFIRFENMKGHLGAFSLIEVGLLTRTDQLLPERKMKKKTKKLFPPSVSSWVSIPILADIK